MTGIPVRTFVKVMDVTGRKDLVKNGVYEHTLSHPEHALYELKGVDEPVEYSRCHPKRHQRPVSNRHSIKLTRLQYSVYSTTLSRWGVANTPYFTAKDTYKVFQALVDRGLLEKRKVGNRLEYRVLYGRHDIDEYDWF